MTALQIKKKVHDLVENADDRLLKMVYALMTEYESSYFEFTAEEKKEIYKRSKDIKSGKIKGLSLEELTTSVRKKLKK
ncbi:hypothetical protein BH11BAC7_BH11BAC7_32470 [soil metagenome]